MRVQQQLGLVHQLRRGSRPVQPPSAMRHAPPSQQLPSGTELLARARSGYTQPQVQLLIMGAAPRRLQTSRCHPCHNTQVKSCRVQLLVPLVMRALLVTSFPGSRVNQSVRMQLCKRNNSVCSWPAGLKTGSMCPCWAQQEAAAVWVAALCSAHSRCQRWTRCPPPPQHTTH